MGLRACAYFKQNGIDCIIIGTTKLMDMTQDNTTNAEPGKEKDQSADTTKKNTAHEHTDIETVTTDSPENSQPENANDQSAGRVNNAAEEDAGNDTVKPDSTESAEPEEKNDQSAGTEKNNSAHEHTDIETVTSDNENIRPVPDDEEQERKKNSAG